MLEVVGVRKPRWGRVVIGTELSHFSKNSLRAAPRSSLPRYDHRNKALQFLGHFKKEVCSIKDSSILHLSDAGKELTTNGQLGIITAANEV